MKKTIIITCFILQILQYNTYATLFDIENYRIGPNPFVINESNLVVNYTGSLTADITFYLYTVTGERIFQKTVSRGAGDNGFILATPSELNMLQPQLYLLYGIFTNSSSTITKKAYLVAKE